jgi:hypothetical protein
MRMGRAVLVDTNIDEDRRAGGSSKTGKFLC